MPGVESGEFDRGVQYGIALAQGHQQRALAEVRRNALVAAHSEPYLLMARRGGFEQGFAAGMQAAQKAGAGDRGKFTYTYQDLENARRRGVDEGLTRKGPDDSSSIRKKLVDEMVEQCRIIAESNPAMAPGVNAVRHRLKKLA